MPGGIERLLQDLANAGVRAELRQEQEPLSQRLIRQQSQPIPSELASGADRLRPPYLSPVAGAIPATAEASRNLEVGFGRLPGPYQRALGATPPVSPVTVGVMPAGYNAAGLRSAANQPLSGLLANSPATAAHELIHELMARRGNPLSADAEEQLARKISGDDNYRPFVPGESGMDSAIRWEHRPSGLSGLLQWLVGSDQ